jgi:hypothetical protein
MNLPRWFRGASVVTLILLMVSRGWPQNGPAHETVLDLKVEVADLVLRGTVQAIQRHMVGQFQEVAVTVKVLETIKGENQSTIEVADSTNSGFQQPYYDDWQAAGHEFLWFLRKPATGESAFSLSPDIDHKSLIPLVRDIRSLPPAGISSSFPPGYLTAELRVLRNPDEILAAVRNAAAYRPTKKSECYISVIGPPGCEVGVPYRMLLWPSDGYVQYVQMPVDERMETLCRRMIQRPDELWMMPAGNSSRTYEVPDPERSALAREQGVRCLRSFRSEANIALLRTVAKEGPAPSTPYYRGPRFDPAAGAAETLRLWGIAVR